MTETVSDRPVKLSCRRLWKVYGDHVERLARKSELFSGDPNTAAERFKRDRKIPAVIDASFDIHVGEIFVIMGLTSKKSISMAARSVARTARCMPPHWI